MFSWRPRMLFALGWLVVFQVAFAPSPALRADSVADVRSPNDVEDVADVLVLPPEQVAWSLQPPLIRTPAEISPRGAPLSSRLSLPSARPDPFTTPLRRSSRRPISRLATVPHMFGDFIGPDIQLFAREGSEGLFTDMPLVAGSRRTKISDNNSPVVMDRAYVTYQHFHNVLQFDADPTLGSLPRNGSVDRFVVGFEKVLFDGNCSIDIRLPALSQSSFPGGFFDVEEGNLGNLTLTPKFILRATDTGVLAAGLGLDLPTGGDTAVTALDTQFTIRNQSFHFLPFVGWLTTPTASTFVNVFAQLDIAANGNGVAVTDSFLGTTTENGTYTEQNLLHLDLAGGCWLWQDSPGPVTGLATLTELHYTSTLQDSDVVDASSLVGPSATLLNPSNRQDSLNLTAGLHLVIRDLTAVRIGGVFPLLADDNRFFDSEVSIQINRRF